MRFLLPVLQLYALETLLMIQVTIKNAGKVYPLEIDLKEPGLTLKLQIYSLTNIPPDRQRILLKGGQVKDDSDLSQFSLKEGQSVMVLGTPEKINVTDNKIPAPKFIEDIDEDEHFIGYHNEPSGLVNLGNTCYLNSSLQVMFEIKEIKERLDSETRSEPIVNHLYQLFQRMTSKEVGIRPLNLLATLRTQFPQFNERNDQGFFKQQDAEELYSQLLSVLLRKYPDLASFFRVEFKTSTRCLETNESPVIGYEDSLKLNCHISINTNFLKDGLINNLKETLEKNNQSLGRDAKYEISRWVTRLPKYLTIHFVRFFWRRDTNKKSKILRKVQFPFQLDLADLLDEEIRESKIKVRDELYKIEKENEDEGRELKKTRLNNRIAEVSSRNYAEKNQQELYAMNEKWTRNFKKAFPDDYDPLRGENPSSLYELVSVVTHQGSSADSGHYQAFVKNSEDITGEQWWKFNDSEVSIVGKDKIEQLSGGGESDSAMILLYKAFGLQ
ncbi:hypothetical protein LJB42_001575 [Komagataella kurtzmanii]|nr:hypothetical protein LJB42_001575 [Komagataella kurtzmanii]